MLDIRIGSPRFRPARSGGSIGSVGTRVYYRIRARWTIRFTVERVLPGRRIGTRCLAPRRSNSTRPRCTRYVPVSGSFTHSGRTGAVNRFIFTGRIGGRALAPGVYRLVSTPIVPPGTPLRRVRANFRIIR